MLTAAELDRLCVVLVATRNPLNIGAAARAMSNFGFLRLRVVRPYEVAFRTARSAVGAAALLANAEEFATVAKAVADCTLVLGTTAVGDRELRHHVQSPMDGAPAIRDQLANGGRAALLFGSEKTGLSNDDLSHCHSLLRIPTRQQHDSMNLGQSVAVCLYELVREAQTSQKKQSHPSSSAELERLTGVLLEALHASGYVARGKEVPTEEKARRLLHRLILETGDAEVLLGMLRQILWKLKHR